MADQKEIHDFVDTTVEKWPEEFRAKVGTIMDADSDTRMARTRELAPQVQRYVERTAREAEAARAKAEEQQQRDAARAAEQREQDEWKQQHREWEVACERARMERRPLPPEPPRPPLGPLLAARERARQIF